MKFKTFSILAILIGGVFFACKNEQRSTEKVEEIRPTVEGGNADLVRNPISADQPQDTNLMSRITFEVTEHNFGEVKEGDVVEYKYKFKNTGKIALLVSNARASCGCTVPEWPKDPIPPGGTGEITAKFNTDGRVNDQQKIITVTANSFPSETKLMLRGHVKPKK